jgi:hypothetical protein
MESLGAKGTKEIDGCEQITRFGKSVQDILDWRNFINLFEFLAFLAGLLCLVLTVLGGPKREFGAAKQVLPHLH